MRKTFLTFCVAALSLLAVSSCGKIWDEFDSVNAEIDALKAKVTALENKLNEEVARINAALDVELVFSVDPETFEVSVSYDGGKTFVATGIIANDNLVEIQWEEGSDEIVLIVGGTAYSIPVYKEDASSIVPGRADFFLHYEGVKSVELTATDITEFYVMSKPNGWKAVLDENVLVVTAPTKAAVLIGAAETEGEILIHATTETGKCKVAKVEVTTGPGLTLAVDAKGNITIENSYASEKTSMWGDVTFGFSDFVFGLATPEDFLADPVAYVETYNKTWMAPNYEDMILPSMYNMVMAGEYVEGEYETDIIQTTVAEMYYNYCYQELEGGQRFVVWIAPADATKEGAAIIEDMIYAEYVYIVHEVEVKEVSHSDITLTANVKGASNYVIGVVAESDYNNEWSVTGYSNNYIVLDQISREGWNYRTILKHKAE